MCLRQGAMGWIASAVLCGVVASGCDETVRDTACKKLSDPERVLFARQELHNAFTRFATGNWMASLADGNHQVLPSELIGVRADELALSYQTPVESDLEMEAFVFTTERTSGFHWSIMLYDTAISGYQSCPTKFTWRWEDDA